MAEVGKNLIWQKLATFTMECGLLAICRVGPILREMGRVEALEWLIKETQPIG